VCNAITSMSGVYVHVGGLRGCRALPGLRDLTAMLQPRDISRSRLILGAHAAASVRVRAHRIRLPVRLACGDEIPTWSRRYIHSRFLCLSATFSRWRAEKSRHQLSSSESQCSHRGPQNQPRDKCYAGRGEATIPTNCRLIQPDSPIEVLPTRP